MKNFEQWLGNFVVQYRWPFILLSLAIATISAMGMGKLTLKNDSRMFFSEENPQLQALEALECEFQTIPTTHSI